MTTKQKCSQIKTNTSTQKEFELNLKAAINPLLLAWAGEAVSHKSEGRTTLSPYCLTDATRLGSALDKWETAQQK